MQDIECIVLKYRLEIMVQATENYFTKQY